MMISEFEKKIAENVQHRNKFPVRIWAAIRLKSSPPLLAGIGTGGRGRGAERIQTLAKQAPKSNYRLARPGQINGQK
jgi:hypothetical protein